MDDFTLHSDKKESVNKTIRFPLKLANAIEEVVRVEDVTYTGFVIQACEYALKKMKPTYAQVDEGSTATGARLISDETTDFKSEEDTESIKD